MASFRVADFSTHFPGPMTSHLLRELGADVVKFENSRHGDGNRSLPPHVDGVSVFHAMLSAGTRSVALDRRSESWTTVVQAAARWADVVVVGGREGDLEDRGLGYDELIAANPQLVYCVLSPYGRRGPWKDLPAHGQNMDAYAGAVTVELDAEARPWTPSSWRGPGTTVAPLFAALGVMKALFERERDRSAKYVEVSIWGAALWYSWRDVICQANLGQPWEGLRDMGSRYGLYRTADDRVLLVCPIERKFWQSFCQLTGLSDQFAERGDWSRGGMDFGAGDDYAAERGEIQARLLTRSLNEWVDILGPAGIPMAPILTLAEALSSDHARAESFLATLEGTGSGAPSMRVPRMPIRTASDDFPPLTYPPLLGQHTDEVLADLGVGVPAPATEES